MINGLFPRWLPSSRASRWRFAWPRSARSVALGDGSSVSTLLSAAKGETSDAAIDALVALQGADVNAALIQAAQGTETAAAAVRRWENAARRRR